MPPTIDFALKQITRQTEEENAKELAKKLNFSYALLDNYPFNLDVLSLVPIETIKEYQFAAYIRSNKKVRVAMVHPEDISVQTQVSNLATKWEVEIERTVVSASSMKYLITAYLKLINEAEEEKKRLALESAKKEEKNFFKKVITVEDLQREIKPLSSITEIIDLLLAAAINLEASDMHLEPGETELTIRLRIDGVLQKVVELPMRFHHQIVARVRIMAAMKLDDNGVSQDGSFSLNSNGMRADFRLSVIPTSYGEGIVMRILRPDLQMRTITELGFSAYNQELIHRAISKPYGLILVTGPTGSGKSTTLYALLQEINSSEKKIITLEDPVEYHIAGLQQSQVNTGQGYTFAEALRGALRQDPDVIMVGEIRDAETATIALNASFTGHLVLSTLHTNNAVTAHVRLLEMGIAPYLLSGSIQAVIAQRLVRKLTPDATPENPKYKGRITIAEILCPNQEFEQAVIAHQDQTSLQDIAIRGGMIPMVNDGFDKVKQGITTEDEIKRVTTV